MRIQGVEHHYSMPVDHYAQCARAQAPWIVAGLAILACLALGLALVQARHEIRCLKGQSQFCG